MQNENHLLAIKKNRNSDDQCKQGDAVSNEVDCIWNNLDTALYLWHAEISAEAVVGIVAPITV